MTLTGAPRATSLGARRRSAGPGGIGRPEFSIGNMPIPPDLLLRTAFALLHFHDALHGAVAGGVNAMTLTTTR